MLHFLHEHQLVQHPDSYECALYDWLMLLGMQTGQRKSEWCQDATEFRKQNSFSRSIKQTSLAFIREDFLLSYKSTPHESTSQPPHRPNYLQITWRFQKNGQNRQSVSFAHNYKHPHLSPVRAAERILTRATRLSQPAHSPLAVYAPTLKNLPPASVYIFHSQVEKSLRTIAKKVF